MGIVPLVIRPCEVCIDSEVDFILPAEGVLIDGNAEAELEEHFFI